MMPEKIGIGPSTNKQIKLSLSFDYGHKVPNLHKENVRGAPRTL